MLRCVKVCLETAKLDLGVVYVLHLSKVPKTGRWTPRFLFSGSRSVGENRLKAPKVWLVFCWLSVSSRNIALLLCIYRRTTRKATQKHPIEFDFPPILPNCKLFSLLITQKWSNHVSLPKKFPSLKFLRLSIETFSHHTFEKLQVFLDSCTSHLTRSKPCNAPHQITNNTSKNTQNALLFCLERVLPPSKDVIYWI